MLIFEITEKKIVFSHYSAIISAVQLYIYLLVPFLLFRKAMYCISSKQGFEPADWDLNVDFATYCAIVVKPLNVSKAQAHHFWNTYKSSYLKGFLLQNNRGLTNDYRGTAYPVPLLAPRNLPFTVFLRNLLSQRQARPKLSQMESPCDFPE